MIRKFMLAMALLLPLTVAQAQTEKAASDTTRVTADGPEQQKVEMADVMRSEGKIYVVVGIILIVLSLMFVYLFAIDRNVKKLEKQLSEKRP
jgi:hypothetical protein